MPDLFGIRTDIGPRPTSVDRSGMDRLRAKQALSSVQQVLSGDFEQALQSLEKANGHVQSARAAYRGPDEGPPDRPTGPRRGLSGGKSTSDGPRRVDIRA